MFGTVSDCFGEESHTVFLFNELEKQKKHFLVYKLGKIAKVYFFYPEYNLCIMVMLKELKSVTIVFLNKYTIWTKISFPTISAVNNLQIAQSFGFHIYGNYSFCSIL